MATIGAPEISVVTTLYQSAPYIREFYARSLAQVRELDLTYEFIFVNDGSPDNALDIALELQRQDSNVVVVDLSRNFGHHKAIWRGLSVCRGERVFLIDCDLEEPPELLAEFAAKFSEVTCDVVYGVQARRKGGLRERLFGSIFYRLFNYLADIEVPANWTIARLMSRRYVDALNQYQEESLFLGGVMSAVGFVQVPITVVKLHKGTTTYTLRRKLSAVLTAVTSFSDKPLRLVFYSGLIISIASFGFAIWFTALKLIFGTPVSGFTALAVSIWLIGGLVILFLGVIGIYISKIFTQAKNRPLTIVRQIYRV